MIKIVHGVFGYNNGKSIIPKTSKDEPFACDNATEKRLVSLGIAEYVTAEKLIEDHVEDAETDAEVVETPVEAETAPDEASKDELIAEYKSLGLGGNPAVMKKETLIKKINEAKEALEEIAAEADEDAPSFDELDGVVG